MFACRLQAHRWAAAAALMIGMAACGPVGPLTTTTPTLMPTPSATPTRALDPEIFSPTAIAIFNSPTPPAATLSPDVTPSATSIPTPEIACNPAPIDPALMGSYQWEVTCDTRYGIGFRHPASDVSVSVTGTGRVDLPIVEGTNLQEKWLEVVVTEDAATCTNPQGWGYEPGTQPTESVTFNGITFLKEWGSNAGAGNLYTWTGYATQRGSTCLTMTFALHSTNRLNYETPPPEFDEAAESAVFEAIMSTLTWEE